MKAHRAPTFKDLYPAPALYRQARREFEETLAPAPEPTPDPGEVVALKLLPRKLFQAVSHIAPPMRIVPEGTGRIAKILLTVPKFLNDRNQPSKFRYARYPDHFSRLLSTFGKSVHWVIVSGDRERPFVDQWLTQAGIPPAVVSHVHSRFDYTIWAQDPYLALQDSCHEVLCEGVLFTREDDMTIADDVDAQVAQILASQSYLFFQGGNVLGGTDTTLIGVDHVLRNTKRFGMQHQPQVLEYFRKLTGTKVLPLGGLKSGNERWHGADILSGHGFQPIFHIDMFVTRTGVRNQDNKEIVFLSRPRAAYDVVDKWSEEPYLDDESIDRFFDETHQQLACHFEVRELPLLSTRGDLGGNEEFVRYYFLTWGNALVEAYGATRRVVIPSFVEHAKTFGLDVKVREKLQQHVVDQWKALNFTVNVIDGLEDLAWGDGSIHCIAKVLAREP